jgi:hypothetical protein
MKSWVQVGLALHSFLTDMVHMQVQLSYVLVMLATTQPQKQGPARYACVLFRQCIWTALPLQVRHQTWVVVVVVVVPPWGQGVVLPSFQVLPLVSALQT